MLVDDIHEKAGFQGWNYCQDDLTLLDSRGLRAHLLPGFEDQDKTNIYLPDPLLTVPLSYDQENRSNTLLVAHVGNYNSESVYHLISHLTKFFDNTEYISIEPNNNSLSNFILASKSSAFVISINADRTVAGLLLGSKVSCCFLNPSFGNYIEVVRDVSPMVADSICNFDSYDQLKLGFKKIIPFMEEFGQEISNKIDQLRKHASIRYKYIREFRRETSVEASGSYKFSVDPREHKKDYAIKDYMNSFQMKSSGNGIFFDPFVVKSFALNGAFRPYLWIGSIEVSRMEDIESLFSCPNFIASMETCRGMIVYDRNLTEVTRNKIDLRGLNVNVHYSRIPLLNTLERFDKDLFMENPHVINHGKMVLSLPLNFGPEDFCLETPAKDNSILVLSDSDPLLGKSSHALSRGQPLVVTEKNLLSSYLGTNYPLVTDSIKAIKVINFLTEEKVIKALEFKVDSELYTSIESFSRFLEGVIRGDQMAL